jgi:phage gpG-like protein
MSASIQIELTPGAIATLQKFHELPTEFPEAIRRGMTRALEVVTGRIQEHRLSGKGPFPVEEHRLGQVTQQLTRSTRSIPATVTSTGTHVEVEGAIGASVFYAAIHEFGGNVPAHTRKTKKGPKPVKGHRVPERAPFRTGIAENADYIAGEIEKEIATTFQ